MRSLMEVHTEEATFTFSGVEWEAPFQGLFFKVVEGLLESVGSFQQEKNTRWRDHQHRVSDWFPEGEF